MPMPANLAARKREETLEAAAAFLEDMQHIREVLARPNPVRGELRRLSGILRRLLPDRDLQNIAPCRNVDPIWIDAPNNTQLEPLIRSDNGMLFFGSGGMKAFGVFVRWIISETNNSSTSIPNFDPTLTYKLRLDNFLHQNVLFIEGEWINRIHAIEYIVKVASGVHSGPSTLPYQKVCDKLRSRAYYFVDRGIATFKFDSNTSPQIARFKYDPEGIDVILMELLSTAQYLANSEDIHRLEATIRAELGGQPLDAVTTATPLRYERTPIDPWQYVKWLFSRIGGKPNKLIKFAVETRLDDLQLTVASTNGDFLRVNIDDDEFLKITSMFPSYVNNLFRARHIDRTRTDFVFRFNPTPRSYEVNLESNGNVLFGLEHPSGIHSVWSLPPAAARTISSLLLKYADLSAKQVSGSPVIPSPFTNKPWKPLYQPPRPRGPKPRKR